MDRTMSLRRMARELGVDPKTVKRYTKVLGLFNDDSEKVERYKATTANTFEDLAAKRDTYRAQWKALCLEHPQEGRKQLCQRAKGIFTWLYRHDKEWLEANLPRARRPQPAVSRVDWKTRDQKMLVLVQEAVETLRSKQGKPVKITVGTVRQQLGEKGKLLRSLHKMPETRSYLDSVAETREQFACRRISWVAEQYIRQQIVPPAWELAKRAGISKDLRFQLQPIIDQALERIVECIERMADGGVQ